MYIHVYTGVSETSPPPLRDTLNVEILSVQFGYRDGLSILTTYSTCQVTEAHKDIETPVYFDFKVTRIYFVV